ncbi:hypothetical protein EB796_001092 [Bugula neritina]|uniref:Uncharacterized protein n=1 Tax=Bugula neritina TaxID=10212 RepID=A0A7J7KQZ3_BUGNE|nr:hypothetical protein EB796_001092 [Bugula neritina]
MNIYLCICESHNVTVYLDPGQSKTNYTLPGCSYTAAYLSEGSYIFYGHCSVYNINVLKSPIVRRLMFVSRYDVSCMHVENAYNRQTLVPSISQQKGNLQTICAPDCNMSAEIETWYKCDNDELTVYWPTDKTFSVVTKEVPNKLKEDLREKLVGQETEYSNVKFQAPRNRTIEARANVEGERIHFLLFSECADTTLTYNSADDLCS